MRDLKSKFLSLEKILQEVLDEEDIYIYGYTIEQNEIHLVYLLKNGDLIYSVYTERKWQRVQIGTFDTKSNTYYQLGVLYIKDKLNIFYTYSNNINSNIITLHHVVYKDNIEARYNIIRYISKKSNTTFSVDYDSNDNIYLLYNTIVNNLSCIYYTYFNPYKNNWQLNPVRISKDDKESENPHLIVDSLNNIHAIWWEKAANIFFIRYHKRNLYGKDMFKWLEMKTLKIDSSIPNGFLYNEDSNIYLVYGDENNYNIVNSVNYGLNWTHIDNPVSLDIQKFLTPLEKQFVPVNEEPDNLEEDSLKEETLPDILLDKDENKQEIEQLINNYEELKILINSNLEEINLLKSRVNEIEEDRKKGFFKRIFG